MCGISSKDINIFGGIIVSVVISLFQIYQFIQLSFDGEIGAIYGIVFTWIASKILSLKTLLKGCSSDGILFYLLALIFQCEWYFNCSSNFDSMLRLMVQILFITFPTNIANIYLLSDTSRDISHGYYIAMIFINYIMFGIILLFYIAEVTSNFSFKKFISSFFSIFANFSFVYLLIQSFLYNKYVGISLIIFNVIVGIIDFAIYFKNSNYYDGAEISSIILSHVFQINSHSFKTYSRFTREVRLTEWRYIIRVGLQCLNIAILFIIKLSNYPLIIELDKAFYFFFVLSLPQLYLQGINFYYKLTKYNQFKLQVQIGNEELKIGEKPFRLLQDRFVLDYTAEFEINVFQLDQKNQQIFCQNIKSLKQFIDQACLYKGNNTKITIADYNNSYILNISFQQYCVVKQSVTINYGLSKNPMSEEILKSVILALNEKQSMINIDSEIEEIEKLLLNIQGFNNYAYQFENKQIPRKIIQPILAQVRSNSFQVLAYQKNIAKYMPINPNHLLYDLYSSNI